jgi:hypothetical protein
MVAWGADLTPPAAAGFNPADYGTVANDFNAATLGLSNGAAVSSFTDSSGNARHATQATAGNQPTYVTASQNGLGVVRFDGSNDYLKTASFTLNQPVTMFVACKFRSAFTAVKCVIDGFGDDCGIYEGADDEFALWAGASLTNFTPGPVWTSFVVVSAVFNGATSQVRANDLLGGASGLGNAGAGNPGGITLGANRSPGQFGDIDLGRAIVYAGSVSGASHTAVVAALKTQWGIA